MITFLERSTNVHNLAVVNALLREFLATGVLYFSIRRLHTHTSCFKSYGPKPKWTNCSARTTAYRCTRIYTCVMKRFENSSILTGRTGARHNRCNMHKSKYDYIQQRNVMMSALGGRRQRTDFFFCLSAQSLPIAEPWDSVLSDLAEVHTLSLLPSQAFLSHPLTSPDFTPPTQRQRWELELHHRPSDKTPRMNTITNSEQKIGI